MNMDETKFESSGSFVTLGLSPCRVFCQVSQRTMEWAFQRVRTMYQCVQYLKEYVMKALRNGMGRHGDVEYSLARMSAIAVESSGA
jgi:hypothetical protein